MENLFEQLRHKFDRPLDIESPSERYYQAGYYQPEVEVFEPPPLWWYDHDSPVFRKPHFSLDDFKVEPVVVENKEQEENSMGIFQDLGRKCDASDCCECPAYFYIHEGGGRQIEENCVSAMRHKEVANAMWKWVSGFDWDTEKLMRTFDDADEDDDAEPPVFF